MTRAEKRQYQFEQIAMCIAAHGGVAKTADLLSLGIDYRRLKQFEADGLLFRVKNGYFTTKTNEDFAYSEERLVASLFSDGVLTMESALFYHGYLAARPSDWKIAVDKNTSKSRFLADFPRVTPYYSEAKVLSLGVTTVALGGGGATEEDAVQDGGALRAEVDAVQDGSAFRAEDDATLPMMQIYTVDRLICDVLKYEEKLSREDFRAAVRGYIDDENKDIAALLSFAKERRVLAKVRGVFGAWLDLSAQGISAETPDEVLREAAEETPDETLQKRLTETASEELRGTAMETSSATVQETPPQAETNLPAQPQPLTLPETPEEQAGLYLFQILFEKDARQSGYTRLFQLLGKEPLSGRHAAEALLSQMEAHGIAATKQQMFATYLGDWVRRRLDENEKTAWSDYTTKNGLETVSWEECFRRIDAFLKPLCESIEKKEAFFGDWMPELSRYLD